MATDRDMHDDEPPHSSNPTARIVEDLALHGIHPVRGEHDPRPMPEPRTIQGALALLPVSRALGLGVMVELEVVYGTANLHSGVQVRGGAAGQRSRRFDCAGIA